MADKDLQVVRSEIVNKADIKFYNWLDEVRLTARERLTIEDIIDDLKRLIDY